MQGYLPPDRKLSEHWQPILQLKDSRQHGSSLAKATQAGNSSSGSSGMVRRCAAEGCRITIDVHFPLVRNATAARLVGSGAVQGHQPAQAAAADWQDHLERLFGKDVSLQEEGDDLLGVSVSPPILQVCCLTVLHIFLACFCKQLLLRLTADLTILQSVIPSRWTWSVSLEPVMRYSQRVQMHVMCSAGGPAVAGRAAGRALAGAQGGAQPAQLAGHRHLAERQRSARRARGAPGRSWLAPDLGCRPHRAGADCGRWGQRHRCSAVSRSSCRLQATALMKHALP